MDVNETRNCLVTDIPLIIRKCIIKIYWKVALSNFDCWTKILQKLPQQSQLALKEIENGQTQG